MKQLYVLLLILSSAAFSTEKLIATPYGTIDADISYSTSYKNALDLYIPHQKKFPVILFIHGGSFVAGDRKEFPYSQIGENFQKLGIGCAVMSYRLLSDSVWPAQPRDVAKAIRWLKDNIAEYGGDSANIIVVGHSAGGQLAALVCTDSIYLNEVDLKLSDITHCVSIGSMMSDAGSLQYLSREDEKRLFHDDWFFKIFGTKENFVESMPIHHVNASMPKMLILLADGELYDPPKEKTVLEFIQKTKPYHLKVSYQVISDRSHMGTVEHMVNESDPAIQSILKFISQ